jgi:hypothetical protein
MKTKVAIIALTLGLVALGLWQSTRPARASARLFLGTTNIVILDSESRDTELYAAFRTTNQTFSFDSQTNRPPIRLTVSDPAEIRQLLTTIKLRAKDPCLCGPHSFAATFQQPHGEIVVRFCNHCFDVYPSTTNAPAGECRNYQMPAEFHAAIRKLIDAEIYQSR